MQHKKCLQHIVIVIVLDFSSNFSLKDYDSLYKVSYVLAIDLKCHWGLKYFI